MLKYPRTPYWPYSPGAPRYGDDLADAARFVGRPVVVTEKLDGGNTLLWRGRAYARSVTAPSTGKWMAMVKKHHAWKVTEPDVLLYGEDIYGVHSIEYDAVPEDETFYAFALRTAGGRFAPFHALVSYARERTIPVVPILFQGTFAAVDDLRGFVSREHRRPSALGGAREGLVIRAADGFPAEEFRSNVCKSVRAGHVQSEEHWSVNWRPCRITNRRSRRGGRSRRIRVSADAC